MQDITVTRNAPDILQGAKFVNSDLNTKYRDFQVFNSFSYTKTFHYTFEAGEQCLSSPSANNYLLFHTSSSLFICSF